MQLDVVCHSGVATSSTFFVPFWPHNTLNIFYWILFGFNKPGYL